MYSFDTRVRFSELAEDGKISIPAVLDLFQDCTFEESKGLNAGFEELRRRNRAWLLAFYQVVFDQRPGIGEEVEVETRAWKFDTFFGFRNFSLKDSDGGFLVRANSLWTLVDTEKMRAARITEFEKGCYPLAERIPMDYAASRKIVMPAEMTAHDPIPVRKDQLDVNHHVNNVEYVAMAAEYIPEGAEIAEIRVEYRGSAVYGDVIYPRTGWQDGWLVTALSDENGKNYASVMMRMRE